MSTGAFDTLTYAKKLRAAGFSEPQAEAQAEALLAVIDENLATKRDLQELEVRLSIQIESIRRDMKELEVALRRDMKELEARLTVQIQSIYRDVKELETSLRRDMKGLELRLTVRTGAMVAASVAVIAALVTLF